MSGSDFLSGNKDEWMNTNLLTKIQENPKLAKLFMNQEYMQVPQEYIQDIWV